MSRGFRCLRDVVFFQLAVIRTARHAQHAGCLGFIAIAFRECQLELFRLGELGIDAVSAVGKRDDFGIGERQPPDGFGE